MKKHTTQVEGLDVEIIKFNPMKGGTVLGTTMKMFAPALKDIARAAEQKLTDAEQVEILVDVVGDLFTRHEPAEVMKFLEDIVASGYVIVNGKKIMHGDDLAALVGEDGDGLYVFTLVAAESLKFNFSKFLGKLMPGPTSSAPQAKV